MILFYFDITVKACTEHFQTGSLVLKQILPGPHMLTEEFSVATYCFKRISWYQCSKMYKKLQLLGA